MKRRKQFSEGWAVFGSLSGFYYWSVRQTRRECILDWCEAVNIPRADWGKIQSGEEFICKPVSVIWSH